MYNIALRENYLIRLGNMTEKNVDKLKSSYGQLKIKSTQPKYIAFSKR